MIPYWNETITIYNKKIVLDEQGRKKTAYVRSVLENCFWGAAKTKLNADNRTIRDNSTITIRIPASTRYANAEQWAALDDCTGLFTLAIGDLIVRGEAVEEVSETMPITAISERYAARGCCRITSTRENLHIPPFHYSASGAM